MSSRRGVPPLKAIWFALVTWLGMTGLAFGAEIDLGGAWNFALDPLLAGEAHRWSQPPADWKDDQPVPAGGWDEVVVPHCWNADPRYGDHTGMGWYRRSVALPEAPAESVWRLVFESVGERCRVWVNGRDCGAYEGAGVPFGVDISAAVRPGSHNFVVVAVDNRWNRETIPGAHAGSRPSDQAYPWINYGGLLGRVRIESLPAAHIAGQKVESVGTEKVKVMVWTTGAARREGSRLEFEIVDPELKTVLAKQTLRVDVAAHVDQPLSVEMDVSGVVQWDLAHRRLYESRVTFRTEGSEHVDVATFGFRDVRVAAAQFLLNGEPVRLAGANRARGHPRFGGVDTPAGVAEDLGLMKDAGLVFSRLQHHPPGRAVLDWADRNGLLIVVEYPAWQMGAAELANPEVRRKFRDGFSALIRATWNHPSVAGWCVGNEYASWTPEGRAWTKEMAALVRSLDPTRPVTFAAVNEALRAIEQGAPREEHGFDDVDFISANFYFPTARVGGILDVLHRAWPEKPVFITEFGTRVEQARDEQERIVQFDRMLTLVQVRPWVCGLSYWSFNDYASRYPGTGADGYRRWGLVDEYRRPRPLYEHVKARLGARHFRLIP